MNQPFSQSAFASLEARDAALEKTRPYVERHHDERYVGLVQTTLTESQMHELIGYRMQLRDLEKLPGFPNVEMPVAPLFVPHG